MFAKNNFPWAFLWNFVLLLLACIMMVMQFVNGSWPGAIGFAMIAYVIVRLIKLER